MRDKATYSFHESFASNTFHSSPSAQDAANDIELAMRLPLPPSSSTLASSVHPESREEHGLALPPVDRGFGAWSFLAAAFIVQTVVWAFPNTYGVFLSAYLSDTRFNSQSNAQSILPLVGTLSSGIIYCSSPFWDVFLRRYPQQRRPAMWLGAAMCFASLLGASYARTINELVTLQGVLYALGASLIWQPALSYLSEWFVERRGMANGAMFAGTALGGLFLPLILPPLISKYGSAVTLRYLSVAAIVTLIPALPFIKPRLPESRVHGPSRREENKEWMKDWRFWALLSINTLQGLAYFVPLVYLPTFTSAIDSSTLVSALPVALLNGAAVFGRIGLGVLSDKFSPWLLAIYALLFSSVVTFVLWGVAGGATAGVVVFGIAYGLVAGGWTSLWNGFVKPLSKGDRTKATSLYSILLFSRGLGNVLSTPISNALATTTISAASHVHTGFDVDGGRYGSMIVYVGSCFAAASTLTVAGLVCERMVAKQSV
ncbi:MFS general substrate transporter [Peniophora sp. CONT]|nr:MFS general substrate transporter [Peniophora sp. CONT]